MPMLIVLGHTQRVVRSPKMHPFKGLAFVCVCLTALCWATPVPSDMTVSYPPLDSDSIALKMKAREEEDVENVDDATLGGLRA